MPVVGTTETTISTFFANFVGVSGATYRFRIRQIEGTAELVTVASRSVVRAQFYPRSRLLASNQTVTPALDTYLRGFFGNEDSISQEAFLFVEIATDSPAAFEKRSHPCFQFDVSAFAGLIWRSVKLQLWRAGDSSEGDGDFPTTRVARILRPWNLTQASWNSFATGSAWGSGGARAEGVDHTTTNAQVWIPVDGPEDEMVQLPDITGIVNDAIQFDGGILKLIIMYPGTPPNQDGFPGRRYHSIEAADPDMRPQLFFDAY